MSRLTRCQKSLPARAAAEDPEPGAARQPEKKPEDPAPPRMLPELAAATARPGVGVPLQPLQIGAHVGGVLVAQVAVFLQRLVNDAFELRRQIRIQPDRRRGQLFQNRIEDQRRSVAAKGQRAGRHFIQHGAKRKQIGARVQLFALGLLGRHVSHRAHRRSGTGQVVLAHGGRLGKSRRGLDCCRSPP